MKTIKASYALLIAVGLLMTGLLNTVMAANYYWDTGAAGGYQPGNGTWDSSTFWTLNGTTLTTWPGSNTNNAYICTTTGTNVVTISSPVSVNQLGLGWNGSAKTDNNWVTLTNSSITVGAGGIIVDGNKTAAIYSDISLAANQTWDIRAVALPVYGNVTDNGNGYGITKTGTSTLSLYGTNSFSGDFIQGAGPVTVYSTSGLPLGSGSLTVSNGLTLSITPAGSGSDLTLLGGTNGNETISFDGYARIYINKGSQTSATYTFGNASDTSSVFTRIGKGTLAIGNQTGTAMIGDANGKFLLANGAAGAPITNGMVDAYIVVERLGGTWWFDFLQYDAVNGLTRLTYDGTFASGKSAGIQDNTKKYKVNNNSFPILTNNTALYALSLQGNAAMTLSNNATLTIGNGTQPAGLNIEGGSLSRAADSSGSRLIFGSSEGIIYTSTGNATIGVPVDGTGGMTFNAGAGTGAITLANENTYSGDTTVIAGKLNVGSGSTSGDLGNSSNLVVYAGATLNFNRSDTFNWGNAINGAGTVQNGGVGTLNVTPPSGTTFAGTLANASSGTMNLTLAGTNTLGTVQNSGVSTMTVNALSGSSNTFTSIKNNSTGTLILDGSANSVNTATFAGASGGFLVFSNSVWKSGGQRNLAGNLAVGGGSFHITTDRLSMGAEGQQLTITGGLLSLTNTTYGLRLGTDNPTGVANGPSFSFTGTQSGGAVVNAQGRIDLGGVTAGKTISYDLADGSMSLLGVNVLGIGAAPNAGSTTTFTLRNAGRLSVAGTIQGGGANDSTALQIFTFAGGTLAANAINATYLRALASAAPGTFINAGGALAPGDIGTAGKTTITGSYSNVPASVLAIDIGGTTQATAFQTGQYDYLRVDVGATTLAGQLRVNLINSYVPLTTNRFTVLLCTNGLSGAFANVSGKILPLTDGYSLFTNVTQSATNVILSGYAVNEYLDGSWDSTASWSQSVIPGDQNYAAYFGALASAFSPNVGTRTLKGLIFANTSSFTLSGTALTLQGDASIKVTAGNHTISVPLALSNATEIAVAPDSLLTLSGGITGGQAVAKTGTGTLALSGVNTLGALTVSAGTVRFTAGTTTVSALTITAGATCDFTAGTLYILKNGGGIDTLDEVNAAITANAITRRGSNALPADFKVTEETINSVVYIKVVAKVNGTVISFQ